MKGRAAACIAALAIALLVVAAIGAGCAAAATTTTAAPTTTTAATTTTTAPTTTTSSSTTTTAAETTTTTVPETTTSVTETTPSTLAATPEALRYVGQMLSWAGGFEAAGQAMEKIDLSGASKPTARDIRKMQSAVTKMHALVKELRAIRPPSGAVSVHNEIVAKMDLLVSGLDDLLQAFKKNDESASAVAAAEVREAAIELDTALRNWAALLDPNESVF